MLMVVNGALPVLVIVVRTVTGVVACACPLYARELGERVTAEVVPVPLRLTVCGLPAALSVIVSVALRVPVAVGVKVTLTVQLRSEERRVGKEGRSRVWLKS